MSYSDKFKDPRWQKKRLEIFNRDNFKCCYCGETQKSLNAHHLCYIKGYDPWEYKDIFILTLCQECHSCFHENPGYSEYFLLKKMEEAEDKLYFADGQRAYDISGILRHFGVSELTVSDEHFSICSLERVCSKEDGSISFKIKELDQDDT
jgi:hypothetical protein